MSSNQAKIDINGALKSIEKSNNSLTPLFEAIHNSLESFNQLQSNEEYNNITINFYFADLMEAASNLSHIEIIDNGIGFNSENYERFKNFFNKTKGFNNRGTGRLQYLHRFEEINVESTFYENSYLKLRKFIAHIPNTEGDFIHNDSLVDLDNDGDRSTKVFLKNAILSNEEKKFFDNLSIAELKKQIVRQFILRFYLDSEKEEYTVPDITINYLQNNGEVIDSDVIGKNDIKKPESEGSVQVNYASYEILNNEITWKKEDKFELIKYAHFELSINDIPRNNICLCSKDVPVKNIKHPFLTPKQEVNGKLYLTAFYGEIFDKPENVTDSVDGFKFESKEKLEKQMGEDDFLPLPLQDSESKIFMEDINDVVENELKTIYSDIINLEDDLNIKVTELANKHGIKSQYIRKADIKLSDTEDKIVEKLFKAESKELAAKSIKANKVFDELAQLNPMDKDYQAELSEKTKTLSQLIDNQNKEELSRYIIRREMVADLLSKILDKELAYQKQPKIEGKNKQPEGLIHDLIFKRKSDNNSEPFLNDLWILNEEFLHFKGCSEQEIKKIKCSNGEDLIDLSKLPDEFMQKWSNYLNKRPDIFLFADEQKALIIELKHADVELKNYINQMTEYCNIIANYGVQKITKFYCYLIGEKINADLDLPGDFIESVDGSWIRPHTPHIQIGNRNNTLATSHIEIMQLSTIRDRAHKRNLSFAEKLGLTELISNADK